VVGWLSVVVVFVMMMDCGKCVVMVGNAVNYNYGIGDCGDGGGDGCGGGSGGGDGGGGG
jgi:hypothetical protein